MESLSDDVATKATRGYDPSVDIAWLRSEIEAWIEGNLMEKWSCGFSLKIDVCFTDYSRGSIKRRHVATSMSQLSLIAREALH